MKSAMKQSFVLASFPSWHAACGLEMLCDMLNTFELERWLKAKVNEE